MVFFFVYLKQKFTNYYRLTPLYAYVLVFSTGVYNFMGSGPFWGEASEGIVEGCYNDWWTNLLYINNLYPVSNSVSLLTFFIKMSL